MATLGLVVAWVVAWVVAIVGHCVGLAALGKDHCPAEVGGWVIGWFAGVATFVLLRYCGVLG